jgi:hypothetical protein
LGHAFLFGCSSCLQTLKTGGNIVEMNKTNTRTRYEYKTEEEAKEAALLKVLIAFSFDIREMKELLYSYREKLTKGGKRTNRKIHYQ